MKLFLVTIIFITASISAQNSWHPTGLSAGMVMTITVDSSGNLYAARWAVGIYKSINGGITWSASGLNGKRIFSIATSPDGRIYAFATNTSTIEIFCSSNQGGVWTSIFTQSTPNNSAYGGGFEFGSNGKIYAVNTVTIGPTIGDVGAYMYLSTNDGITWINKDLIGPGPIGGRSASGFTNHILLGSNNKLFAATSDQTLLYTTNDGNNWLSAGIPVSAYLRGLGKDAQGNIYAGLAGDGNNLFFSTNNGTNWELKALQLPYFDLIEDILVTHNNNTLYIATGHNVFRSTDAGNTFDTINGGFPENASVLTLSSTPAGSLFSGTLANGVYMLGNPIGIINNSTPVLFNLRQNYPNPFNPSTTIRFDIPEDADVKVTIFDILGREVQILADEFKQAGSYEIHFDASQLSSGTYLYRIDAGGFSDIKKMILIK